MRDQPMVILGAGQAGGRTALTLREQGYDGRIVLLGAEPCAPYERPPLSKAYLTGERNAGEFTFAKAAALEAAGIEFHPDCVVAAIDRRTKTVRVADGETLPYAKLLLATGREPRRMPLGGAVAERVLYLRDLRDADRLRQALRPGARIAIIGGGFIGLEVAALATADPDVFAAGDVCAFPHAMAAGLMRLECWKNANAQGALAARNMLGAGEACIDVPWFWSDQYELTLQMAGVPERGDVTVERDIGPEARRLFHLDRSGRLVGMSGVGPSALGRDLRIGQIMIERGLAPDPAALADPAARLKALLR